ncbi:MAG: STAS domain-containing protein [Planctomycetota bacterium]
MITSYVSPKGTLLYLSLVGTLDREAVDDLVREFDERLHADATRCLLDLNGAEDCDAAGLSLVTKLADRSRLRRVRFGVTATNSPIADKVRQQAGELWLEVLPELPLSA